jgi:hypothetical protein
MRSRGVDYTTAQRDFDTREDPSLCDDADAATADDGEADDGEEDDEGDRE